MDNSCPHGNTRRRKCGVCRAEDDEQELTALRAELAAAREERLEYAREVAIRSTGACERWLGRHGVFPPFVDQANIIRFVIEEMAARRILSESKEETK